MHQWSYVPTVGSNQTVIRTFQDFKEHVEIPQGIPLRSTQGTKVVRTGETVDIKRKPTEAELKDMWFARMVETCVTPIPYLPRKTATISIGAGGRDAS